ncbi:HD-GYP domain-containing protein [Anaerocolumna sp. MB42-C2]|uniref:HD-GYP domain-containing protein n=1 Tax=Anaerocolumna sp. MB42-C2 TaxID=3070997 RepID=UPI0027E1EAF1|nr:HD-GYP domain-containing protein [Anaerocolumna sp. MB42-C2]WMJ85306.1 HD-GYP domain-containing protein [Anaerocolumna sp. MB42-C2]
MKKKRITVKQATPGMVAGEDIYNYNNQLVISEGTTLTDKIITRLKFYSINDFSIILEDVKKPTMKDASHSQMTRESIEFKQFSSSFMEALPVFKGELNKIEAKDTTLDINGLIKHTTQILSKSRNGIHVFDMLHCMREFDDLTYVHSINVALIANVFGHWLKLPEKDIDILTASGLLHDIGKLTLPSEIINKQDSLTASEYSTVKTHTVKGYQILKNKDVDLRIKYTALMHHERCDGSGYPNGFHGSEIDSFAKIIAIADVYDAMTSARVYRPALCPFEALSLFEAEGLQKFDPHYIMTFLQEIVQSYVGKRVRLSDQTVGEIRLINNHYLSKPIVQVGNRFIDLSKEHKLIIEAII